jgi:Flp pilus assembly pilin Flp
MKRSLRNFHENEAGLEALQVVMIVAVAAVCLIAIKAKWPDIKEFFNNGADEVVGFDS